MSASALATSEVSRPLRSRPNSTPQRSPRFDAPAHLRHRLDGSEHRLAQVALARGRCRQPIEVADRCVEGREVRRIVDDVVGAGRGDPRLLVRPAVARRDEAQIVEAEVGHGARHHADVVGELRLHQQYGRRSRPRRQRPSRAAPSGGCRGAACAGRAAPRTSSARRAHVAASVSRLSTCKVRFALAGDAHRAVADDDLAIAGNEAIEAGDALGLDALGAAGAASTPSAMQRSSAQ